MTAHVGGGFPRGLRGPLAAIAIVWAVTTILWFTPGLIRPDGVAYFVYLPSTWIDHDLLFIDEWAKVGLIRDGQIIFKDITPTAHLGNHWTVGASLAWYPSYLLGELLSRLGGGHSDGFTIQDVTAVAFTSAAAGLFVLLLGFRLARRWFSEWTSAAAAIGIWLGSPLAWYSLRHATMSHAISAAVCAIVLLLSLRLRHDASARAVFATGLAIGFACTVRPQNIVVGLVPLIVAGAAPVLRRVQFFAIGGVIAALPQLIASQVLFGGPLVFVNIGGRAHSWQMFTKFRPVETIFSWYHGLVPWTPLLVLALAGLAFLWREDRRIALAGLTMFLAQLLLLSILERWFWGGASFGQRRFDSCTIFFILGLAAFLDRVPRWMGATLTVAATLWTMALFVVAGHLNLNRFQMPGELFDVFRSVVHLPDWRTPLGYTPASLHAVVLTTMLATAVFLALVALAAWRGRAALLPIATLYLLGMSAFYLWCGTHPKYDALSSAIVASAQRGEIPSAARRDMVGLLRDEALYMERVGRHEEAEAAMQEARALSR